MKTIVIAKQLISDIQSQYESLPTDAMEFGGVVCGAKNGDLYTAKKLSWIPSAILSRDAFIFDNIALSYPKAYCGNDDIVAIFHTHSPDLPFPSKQDREVSKEINEIGCIVAPKLYMRHADDPYMNCFIGNIDVIMRIDPHI